MLEESDSEEEEAGGEIDEVAEKLKIFKDLE